MCDQHIFRFDVAVDSAACMGMLKSQTDLPQYLEDLLLRYFAIFILFNEATQVFLAEFFLSPDVFFSFEPAKAADDVRML